MYPRALQLMLNMTQIISHRFLHARLQQSNISKEISGNIGICSFPLPGPEGGNADCVYVCVCACCVYLTSGHEREQEKALRRDGRFSHMGNSIGARENTWTNSVLYIEPSDVYLPMISHSLWNWCLQCVWLSLWIDMGSCACGNYVPPPRQDHEEYFPWMSLNCKQCPYISYEYTQYGPRSVWPEGGVCCVACQTLWYFLRRSDPISGVLWRAASQTARPGLGRWQWHTEAVDFWYPAVTNCEEKVRETCSGAILKDMEIQPASPRYGLAQMKSLNHENSEGERLYTAASVVLYGSNIGGQL